MTNPLPLSPGLGTQLRHVLDLLEGDIAKIYAELGIDGFRPRFTPVIGALRRLGPSSIRDLAAAVSVTHSAASQTVAQMKRHGLVSLQPGADARQRIVHLTPAAESLLPALEAEWIATQAASDELEAELPYPLSDLLANVVAVLERRPFHRRITERFPAVESRSRKHDSVVPHDDRPPD